MPNSTLALLIRMLFVAVSLFMVFKYKQGAEYWQGRAEREIHLKERAIRSLQLCSIDLEHLEAETRNIHTGLTTLRSQTHNTQQQVRDPLREQARLERAVQTHCPAAMREIMAETIPSAPPR